MTKFESSFLLYLKSARVQYLPKRRTNFGFCLKGYLYSHLDRFFIVWGWHSIGQNLFPFCTLVIILRSFPTKRNVNYLRASETRTDGVRRSPSVRFLLSRAGGSRGVDVEGPTAPRPRDALVRPESRRPGRDPLRPERREYRRGSFRH